MAKTQFPSNHQTKIPAKRILGALLSLLVFFLLLMSVIRLGEKYFAVRARNREMAAEAVALQQKETALASSNAYLLSPSGTEQSLRERFNYVKPGEGMIIISDPDNNTPPPPPQSAVGRWWSKLLHGIGLGS